MNSNIFDTIQQERGGVAKIHSGFSDFPIGVAAHYEFYRAIMLDENLPLSRHEREILAVEVSQSNSCPYCIAHHQEALNKTEQKTLSDEKYHALQSLSITISSEPHRTSAHCQGFLAAGYTKDQWQHAVMVASYFNFANRCAHAMGLEVEADFQNTCL